MKKHILIAGGGTGGHLFPGIAIAEAFMAENPKNRILFVSDGKHKVKSVLSKSGFQHGCITIEGLKRRGPRNQLMAALKIPVGIFESVRILRHFKPDLVIGLGGYSAGPAVIAAWLLGIKIVLQEQNVLPGITNRILSCFADRIYVSFPNSKFKIRNPKKICFTGNPVRKEFQASNIKCQASNIKHQTSNIKHQTSNIKHQTSSIKHQASNIKFTVMIVGGSQGAHSVNMAVTEAIDHIKDKDRFLFVHQTGEDDAETVKEAYANQGITCTVSPFFDDMARQYQKADLLICRAGATTVAEVTAVGKGAIFIPYPYAADNHQVLNAQTLTKADAAEMILQKDISGKMLADKIEYYASNPEQLEKMESRAKLLGRPRAAEAIVGDCYNLMFDV